MGRRMSKYGPQKNKDRLAAALRENLLKRKEQSRARDTDQDIISDAQAPKKSD
jgi:hypothetical protein